MQAFALQIVKTSYQDLTSLVGQVIAANVPNFETGTGFTFRKGHILQQTDITSLQSLQKYAPVAFNLHLLSLEEGDITEDAAGQNLAQIVAGPGIVLQGPFESRMNLVSRWRGLLKVDVPKLDQINEVPGLAVFTLFNDQAVEVETEVAGAKVTPLVYPKKNLLQAESILAGKPIIDVKPFLPLKVGVVVRESLPTKARSRFEKAVTYKINWFGGQLLDIETSLGGAEDLAQKLEGLHKQGANLILHVGGHSTDPLDPMHHALNALDVRIEKSGAPAHPGTLFWLGYFPKDTTVLFGLASCGMFSKTTLGDLFLAKFFAGEHLTYKDVAQMGYGGLLGREMAFRFPPYKFENE